MSTFKEIAPSDIKTSKSFLNQLVDIVQEDVSGSNTRKKYQVFVTGGLGPGVTSSMFQTVYDQDFTLQTSNAMFDMTVGLYSGSATVFTASSGIDSNGKLLFPASTLMMREKVDIYKQAAQIILGDSTLPFYSPFGSTDAANRIDEALIINYKRLFRRDKIKKETYAAKIYASATVVSDTVNLSPYNNLNTTSILGSSVYTDAGASTTFQTSFGGELGNIVDASNTSQNVGLIFYDQGIVLFDIKKIISGSQRVSGTISSITSTGQTTIGNVTLPGGGKNATFIPDLMISASIDDIVDHFASCRFSSGTLTGQTFQNITNINSTLVFCRATADEFNYSSNPTATDDSSRIVVIDPGQEATQTSFTFISSIGLYDANNNLLAVAKLSRPVQKTVENDLTFRIRLDF
jgi:hypothetical protein